MGPTKIISIEDRVPLYSMSWFIDTYLGIVSQIGTADWVHKYAEYGGGA